MTAKLSMTDLPKEYQQQLDNLMLQDIYKVTQIEKETLLLPLLNQLHQHHRVCCNEYDHIVSANQQGGNATQLTELPFLAVRLFKQLDLLSIESDQIFRILQSSGTTAQTPAKIFLDKTTSARQSKALVNILQSTLGKKRLPMLIIDAASTVNVNHKFSARAAGIQGLAFFGRDHCYALDKNMKPDWAAIDIFSKKYADQPILVFGFTFMLWEYFIRELQKNNLRLNFSQGTVLHSGGWKKLEASKVDNITFKKQIKITLGVPNVYNFYGMAEQVGTIFVECTHGRLHAPLLADVIVRDQFDLSVCPNGKLGIIQVMSALPSSYPGFSLLTEDVGSIDGIDDCLCGRLGKTISIQGRLPKTEVRGCSDTQLSGSRGLS